MVNLKKSKNQLRRERAKQKKLEAKSIPAVAKDDTTNNIETSKIEQNSNDAKDSFDEGVKVEEREPVDFTSGKIFASEIDKLLDDPAYSEFKLVFNKFHTENTEESKNDKGDVFYSDDEVVNNSDSDSDSDSSNNKLTKRQVRKLKKITLATLKAEAKRPEVVEWYDVDAADPKLLVFLKSLKNGVLVPPHWQLKREYLSSKRGIEKAPFQLPGFIVDTGITDMRDTTKTDDSTMKQRMRERVQPKMGKLDIDYQKLHDAFFKFQTKPNLYKYGDVYYEGRDIDVFDVSKFRPGHLSEELRNALGIPAGAPPPWLINMKTMGPPPAYPHLLIPGINAPLTSSETEGYQNETVAEPEHFGQIVSDEEESEEEGEVEDEDEDAITYERGSEDEDAPVIVKESNSEHIPISEYGRVSEVSQITHSNNDGYDENGKPKRLYQVIDEKKVDSAGFMGSDRAYRLPGHDQGGHDQANNELSSEESKSYSSHKRPSEQSDKKTHKKYRF